MDKLKIIENNTAAGNKGFCVRRAEVQNSTFVHLKNFCTLAKR